MAARRWQGQRSGSVWFHPESGDASNWRSSVSRHSVRPHCGGGGQAQPHRGGGEGDARGAAAAAAGTLRQHCSGSIWFRPFFPLILYAPHFPPLFLSSCFLHHSHRSLATTPAASSAASKPSTLSAADPTLEPPAVETVSGGVLQFVEAVGFDLAPGPMPEPPAVETAPNNILPAAATRHVLLPVTVIPNRHDPATLAECALPRSFVPLVEPNGLPPTAKVGCPEGLSAACATAGTIELHSSGRGRGGGLYLRKALGQARSSIFLLLPGPIRLPHPPPRPLRTLLVAVTDGEDAVR